MKINTTNDIFKTKAITSPKTPDTVSHISKITDIQFNGNISIIVTPSHAYITNIENIHKTITAN